MNYPCLFVVAVLLLCAYGDLVKDGRLVQATDRPLEWNLVVDKSNRAASHFSFTNRKEKKPHIDKVISPSSSPIENVKTSSVNSPPDRTLSRVSKTEIDALKQTDATGYRAPLSTQSKSSFTRASTCSSRLYEVNLRHLNCSKRIFTKVWLDRSYLLLLVMPYMITTSMRCFRCVTVSATATVSQVEHRFFQFSNIEETSRMSATVAPHYL